MPYSVVDKGSKYFNTKLYTGTGASLANTGVGFKPDWVWIKGRSGATDHGLYDAVRGVQKQFESNNTDQETTEATGLTAFGTDGFTVGALAQLNTSSATYVAWNWLGANTTVSNTVGTITSTVSVNTTSGFSIVSYTGNQVAGATVGHGLGVKPALMIVKLRSGDVAEPMVYHSSTGATKAFKWNESSTPITNSTIWNNTEPTTTVFSVGTSNNVNHVYPLIAYCFSEVKGYSKFGSYTGNGSTDGTFVYTGFKPAFVIVKISSGTTNNWTIMDNKINTSNTVTTYLIADTSGAQGTDMLLDFLSNGFKPRASFNSVNGSGYTYIYMAFAENPFVTSGGIPCTAR
jgi:hypothetical protein